MLTTELYTSTQTIGSTEFSLTNHSTTLATRTTAAVVSLWLYSSAAAAGDEFEVYLLEKVVTGGTQRKIYLGNIVGAMTEPFVTSAFQVGVGWDFSMKKISGTDRSFEYSVRSVT